MDDDFVGHPAGVVRESLHPGRIAAGNAGGSLEEETAGGATGDEAGFGAGKTGDFDAGFFVELVDVNHYAGGAGHLRQHFGAGAGAAEAGDGAGGVDDRVHAEAAVGGFGGGDGLLLGRQGGLLRAPQRDVCRGRFGMELGWDRRIINRRRRAV